MCVGRSRSTPARVWDWWNCSSDLNCITLVPAPAEFTREEALDTVHLGAPFKWDGARIARNEVVRAAGSTQGQPVSTGSAWKGYSRFVAVNLGEESTACAPVAHRADVNTVGSGVVVLGPWNTLDLRNAVL